MALVPPGTRRNNRYYLADYRDAAGKRKSISLKTTDEIAAQRKFADLLQQRQLSSGEAESDVSYDAYVMWLADILTKERRDKYTVYAYKRAWRLLKELYPLQHLSQVTPKLLRQAKRDWLDRGVGNYEVVNRIKCIICGMRMGAVEEVHNFTHDWTTVKPRKGLELPRGREAWYNDVQLNKLLAAASNHDTEPQMFMKMFYLCAFAGLQPDEARTRQRADIDFDLDKIAVDDKPAIGFHVKTQYRRRQVDVLFPELKEKLLRDHLHDHPEAFLCRASNGRLWTLNAMQHHWRRIVQKSGVGFGFLYTLRHTFCSKLFNLGYDPAYVQEQMGHGSLTTTEIYKHKMPRPKPPQAHLTPRVIVNDPATVDWTAGKVGSA